MNIGSPKCPYCRGDNLYLKRTWPTEAYGCRDCERRIAMMRKEGLTDKQIKRIIGYGR